MFFVFKVKHFKTLLIITIFFILSHCQLKKPVKGHGINFLENRSNKITLNKTNKNDIIQILGNPHTKSISDENLWFYFDRKVTSSSLLNIKNDKLIENNVLVVKFNNKGIAIKKEFYNKDDMKKIVYLEKNTDNPVTQESFVSKFLQSVRQKMYGKRKF
tara:strand:+ start:306 stop:782 length:477 start_codon:yes stop_codon:yes gene_type:complete